MKALIGLVSLISLFILVGAGATLDTAKLEKDVKESKINLTTPFSLERGYGYYIPPGSVVYYSKDGATTLYGPDGIEILKINDSDVPLRPTPAGYSLPVTHIFQIPSGAHIERKDNIYKVYKNRQCILTVIDYPSTSTFSQIAQQATYSGWIEQANDWTVANLDRFWAYWDAPLSPPNPNPSAVDFLFNAIEPSDGSEIIQPVLEWNWGGSGRWTAAAWQAIGNIGFRSAPINVNVGDTLYGELRYSTSPSYDHWIIFIKNLETGKSTFITTNTIGTSDLAVFVALEGHDITGDDDVPGDTTFYNMNFLYNSNPVDIAWNPEIDETAPLTELGVIIYSDSSVKLVTAN